MKRIIAFAFLSLAGIALGGCPAQLSTLKKVYSTVTETRVSGGFVTSAGDTFVLLETGGALYLTHCDGKPSDSICASAIERAVIDNMRKGRAALNALKTELRTSPDATASTYNVLITSLNFLQGSPASTFGAATP